MTFILGCVTGGAIGAGISTYLANREITRLEYRIVDILQSKLEDKG